jgi:hypothetical protein
MSVIRDKNIDIDIDCDDVLRGQLFEMITHSPSSEFEKPDLDVPEIIRFHGIPTLRWIIKKHSKSRFEIDDEFTDKTSFCNKVMVEFYNIKMHSKEHHDKPFVQLRDEIHNMLSKETHNFGKMIQKSATSPNKLPSPNKNHLKKTQKYTNIHGNKLKYSTSLGGKSKTNKTQKTKKNQKI